MKILAKEKQTDWAQDLVRKGMQDSFLIRVSEEGVEERHLSRADCGLLGPVCLLQQGFSGLGDFLSQFIFVG